MGARSLAAAIAGLMDGHSVFGPDYPDIELPTEIDQKRRAALGHLAAIIVRYRLGSTEKELRFCVLTASDLYWRWWVINHSKAEGLGSKNNMDALERALWRSAQLLADKQIHNRLEETIAKVGPAQLPTGPAKAVYYQFGDSIFESLPHSRATISGLLEIVRAARKIEGRANNVLRRDDVRSAAVPLRKYWVEVAGRSAKLQQRGGVYNESVSFLHDCLALIDPTVTKRLLVDLDK